MPASPSSRTLPFPRACRLRRRRDFQLVLTRGTRPCHGRFVALRVYRRPSGPPRLGLAVGRRVGNAPRRNRIKRRLREVFRLNLPQLPGGVDLLVTARDPLAATCSFTLLQEDFLATLHRALRRSPPPPPAAREQDRD